MSYSPTGRFRFEEEEKGLGDVYGSYNVAEYTKVRCPVCHQIIWVPRGQFDTTHDCTITCPYDSVRMEPIPADPSAAKVPLIVKSADDMMTKDHYRLYFYYCPSSTCPFLVDNGYAYMQQRVQVDLLVGR
jgi:hypothetical protein